MKRHALSAKQAQWVAQRRAAIEQINRELAGGLSMLIAEAGLEGNWSLAADGLALEQNDPAAADSPAAL